MEAAKGGMGVCEGIGDRQQEIKVLIPLVVRNPLLPTVLPMLSESLTEMRQPVFQKSNNEKIKSRRAVPPSTLLINS